MKRYIITINILFFCNVFSQSDSDLWDIFALSSDTVFACGSGSVYRTMDGGDTWEINKNLLGIGRAITSVHFLNEKNGWMVTRSGGYLFNTNDCGKTWNLHTINHNTDINLYKILFLDSLRGWVCGSERECVGLGCWDNARMWVTTDGGESWTIQYFRDASTIKSLILNNDIGGWWGGIDENGYWGTIYKSSDEGITWNKQSIPDVNAIENMFFLDSLNGWAISNHYSHPDNWFTQLIRTVDGGKTWNIQNNDFEYPINNVFFINDSIGYGFHSFHRDVLSPNPAILLKTTDSGNTWNLHSIYDDRLGGMYFINENVGWIVGENELILKTIDGGKNWEKQDDFVIVDNINSNYIPNKFELFQNYPNPFNSSTKIRYSISKPSMVSLKIYDLLGHEVETLVNQYQGSGRHVLSFFGDNFSSGLYFYTITVDDKYCGTRKMLLIR